MSDVTICPACAQDDHLNCSCFACCCPRCFGVTEPIGPLRVVLFVIAAVVVAWLSVIYIPQAIMEARP